MQIAVTGGESCHPQARTYAEYRLFSVLARYAGLVRRAEVVITENAHTKASDRMRCAVTIRWHSFGQIHTVAHGDHAYEAINRAVDCLRELLAQQDPGWVPAARGVLQNETAITK